MVGQPPTKYQNSENREKWAIGAQVPATLFDRNAILPVTLFFLWS
jgi:hypothetical protein